MLQRVRFFVCLLVCFLAVGWAVSELRRPTMTAACAECGDGPKDKKCADGYKCVESKCVKK